ncbi:MAG: hypothetical protein HY900_36350 [Deltaproteobacteria bacterium]|nr:hypothetical protein [Deltaproteobacteria bacterium]
MNALFDICHPAHFHLFRHAMKGLAESGQNLWVTARSKDVTVDLLRDAGVRPLFTSRPGRGKLGAVLEMVQRDLRIWRVVRSSGIDLMVGTSPCISHVSRLSSARSVVFNEDDASVVPLFVRSTYPFADYIVTPRCLAHEGWGGKHVVHDSYHELAYLHPDVFTPDPTVLNELGVERGEFYSIVRLSALAAHHDKGARGIDEEGLREVVRVLRTRGRAFTSCEVGREADVPGLETLPLPADRLHHALAFAGLYVGDSQTMTAEASVLGVPALRCNSFVGRISYLEELESRYGLTFGYRPEDFSELLAKLRGLVGAQDLGGSWQRKRAVMLSEKISLSGWILEFLSELSQSSSGVAGSSLPRGCPPRGTAPVAMDSVGRRGA